MRVNILNVGANFRGSILRCALLHLVFLQATAGFAQDPVTAFPKNYSVAFENYAFKVVRVHYGPYEKIGVHNHSELPTVYVYLSDSGPVRFQHFEDAPFALTRPPTVKGAFRVSPGRLERHSVENLGDTSSDFLRVELKQIPLGHRELNFRSSAPPILSSGRTAVEFKNPMLEVQRLVCQDVGGCEIKINAAPSLVVAFTDARVSLGALTSEAWKAGAVRWVPASQALRIAPTQGSSAHMLRISLPAARE